MIYNELVKKYIRISSFLIQELFVFDTLKNWTLYYANSAQYALFSDPQPDFSKLHCWTWRYKRPGTANPNWHRQCCL